MYYYIQYELYIIIAGLIFYFAVLYLSYNFLNIHDVYLYIISCFLN